MPHFHWQKKCRYAVLPIYLVIVNEQWDGDRRCLCPFFGYWVFISVILFVSTSARWGSEKNPWIWFILMVPPLFPSTLPPEPGGGCTAADSWVVESVTKNTTGCSITVRVDPGGAEVVTFNLELRR